MIWEYVIFYWCPVKQLPRIIISQFYFVSLWYFCLDTKVPKNQGKKNAARSASSFFPACARASLQN